MLHLLLRRVAVADDRLLYLQRGVLGHRQARDHRGADRRAARLAEEQRRLGIHVHENLLDRDLDRTMLRDHFAQPFEDGFQPRGEITIARFDATAGDVTQAPAVLLDHAEAGGLQARVDAEDLQSSTAVV